MFFFQTHFISFIFCSYRMASHIMSAAAAENMLCSAATSNILAETWLEFICKNGGQYCSLSQIANESVWHERGFVRRELICSWHLLNQTSNMLVAVIVIINIGEKWGKIKDNQLIFISIVSKLKQTFPIETSCNRSSSSRITNRKNPP